MEPLREAVARCRADGVAIAAWSFCLSDSRQLSLGVKDREAGNAHYPLRIVHSRGARYRLVWEDGRVSRGHLERGQLESRVDAALLMARRCSSG